MDPEEKAESSDGNAGVPTRSDGRKMSEALLVLALFLCLFLFFCIVALRRPADVDEGFFLVFGKSIFLHGRTVYLDFFSAQTPLLPYVYGSVMKVFGFEWKVARLLCAFLAAAIGAIICKYAFEKTGSRIFAASVAVIYCFAPFVFIWFTCSRTPALATFLLLFSVSLLRPIKARASALLYVISGFALGLSIDTRLYIVAVVPVLAFHVGQVEEEGIRRAVAYFLGGVAAALMVNLPFLIVGPMGYLWGVVGVHAAKTTQGFIGNFGQKLDLLLQLLFDYPALRPTLYLGYLMVLVAYLGNQVLRRIRLSEWNPAFYVAGTMFLVSLLPTPTYGRYFSVPVPFFLLLAIDLAQTVFQTVRVGYAKRAAIGAVMLGAVLFAWLAFAKIDFYIFEGNNLGGSMPTEGGKDDWSLENVQKVSQVMDRLVAPDANVLSLWPGYLLESRVTIMPRTENLTTLEFEDRLSENMIALSQTITDAEIRDGIRNKEFDLLIYGNSIAPHVSEYKALLIENGYAVAEKIGGISLFLSPEYERRAPAGS